MVLIIGGGNSAFESADYLSDTAAIVQVAFNRRIQFAWDTHYVGMAQIIHPHSHSSASVLLKLKKSHLQMVQRMIVIVLF